MARTGGTTRTGATGRSLPATVQNLLLRSEEFDHTIWSKSTAATTITANQVANPVNGAIDADLMSDSVDASSINHYVLQAASPTLTVGAIYTMSVYLKANGVVWMQLNNNGNGTAWFDIVNGALGTHGGTSFVSSSIEAVPNQSGWYRCSMTYVSTGQAMLIWMVGADGSVTYQGDGTKQVYIWGAQIVQANWAGPYTQTVASAVNTGIMRSTGISYRVPIDFLNLGITHLYDWSTGFIGTDKTHVPNVLGNAPVDGYNFNTGTAYTQGQYSVLLDGINDYFKSRDMKVAGNASSMTALTIFGWYKLGAANAAGSQLLSVYRQTGTLRSWSVRYLGTSGSSFWRMFLSSDGALQYTADTAAEYVTDLAWHFFTYTYTPSGGTFYINGAAVATGATSGTFPAQIHNPVQAMDIGSLTGAGGTNGSVWNGSIGLCGLSTTTALSASQVLDLYNLTNGIGRYL